MLGQVEGGEGGKKNPRCMRGEGDGGKKKKKWAGRQRCYLSSYLKERKERPGSGFPSSSAVPVRGCRKKESSEAPAPAGEKERPSARRVTCCRRPAGKKGVNERGAKAVGKGKERLELPILLHLISLKKKRRGLRGMDARMGKEKRKRLHGLRHRSFPRPREDGKKKEKVKKEKRFHGRALFYRPYLPRVDPLRKREGFQEKSTREEGKAEREKKKGGGELPQSSLVLPIYHSSRPAQRILERKNR